MRAHDIRFVEDDWESPTLGAWGLGWEVWCDGMEVTQFTYFQQVGGFDCKPVSGEITYGLERLAMYVQGVDDVYKLRFNDGDPAFSYGDVFRANEQQQSRYNFELADTDVLLRQFREAEAASAACIEAGVPLPAYEQAIRASHLFNLLRRAGGDFGGGAGGVYRAGARAGGGGVRRRGWPGTGGRERGRRREGHESHAHRAFRSSAEG